MRTETPSPVRLTDYRPPAFLIEQAALDFDLHPDATRVTATLKVQRNGAHDEPLRLNGERLKLLSLAVDGRPLGEAERTLDEEGLTIPGVPDAFELKTQVEIDPEANKALDGLYMSAGRFCTQCEAEGFRKITFYPDRPDVLSRFTVRVTADKAFGRLLSNGNLMESGDTADGRHFAVWNDPFPKPCYLFALVAGELDVLEDDFVTMSGRRVALKIFVDPGMSARAAYAMDSLKRAMAWDETAFGREYDLDLFMIVAVRDFNYGAMENKGLNIFNSSLLLADPETATDVDYERIEGVVAHEYFHNWTGNRITCRDWFQLCLKEGLTVFRDQSFSADMRGHAVQRIKEVRTLRARQFSEDASPIAHPVRPSAYQKIDNFYTATIYEKGAEIIRMLKVVIGDDAFKRGMDLYFERWDGHATTVEAFIDCFAEASGRDLKDFFGWYEQAGTPKLTIEADYDEAAQRLNLTLIQETAPTPGQPTKRPLPIPIALSLLDAEGREMRTAEVVVLDEPRRTLTFENLPEAPVISALRGFSAPVSLDMKEPAKDAYLRMASDSDLFNRWEAAQGLARELILARAADAPDEVGEERFAEALGRSLDDQSAEPAFKALMLGLPTEPDLAVLSSDADPAAIHAARDALRGRIAVHLAETLKRLHGALQDGGEFSPDADAAGRRALRNAALIMLTADPHADNRERARGHFTGAGNMTDAIGGLNAMILLGGAEAAAAVDEFFHKWEGEPLVIDKWFSVQAMDPAEDAVAKVVALTGHPAFDPRNPNRLRSLVGAFAAANPARFHASDGSGYRFLADQILAVDAFNPMVAARFVEPLASWRRYRPDLAEKMKAELERVAAAPKLSKNVRELVGKALA
ncbi:MAG TPA: aminopeptidase N [Caulobacteraceae bacterium]|jgi:aminopeptidase N|nr:aminopeptidase N [Caulobacteraceae bacterium]